ncbi:MAG: endonuclease V [Bacteroidota bacterium]
MDKKTKHQQTKKWAAEQLAMLSQLSKQSQPWTWPKKGVILSLDIQYEGNTAFSAVDLSDQNGKGIGMQLKAYPVEQPYVSGFFSFREGPILVQAIQQVQKTHPVACILVDGHGRAHPRKMGLACWVGIKLDLPTVGVAKRSLLQYSDTLDQEQDAVLAIKDQQEVLGWVWRSRENVKPLFVSPGHRMDADLALDLAKKQAGSYRQIESLRRADFYARRLAKGLVQEGVVFY